MKITDIETIILRLPEAVPNGDGLQDVLIVRVHTDTGITGIGEAHTSPQVVKAIIDAPISQLTAQGLRQLLVGRDPRKVEELWDLMYDHTTSYGRRGVVVNAISGIDIALWDILGKASGVPVHRLLGGSVRQTIRAYASDLWPATAKEAIDKARSFIDQGFRAMKFGWGGLGDDVDADAATVAEIRQAVGPDVDIMVDMGMPVPFDDALRLAEVLAESNVFFLEEPLSPDDLDGFARLVEASPTPIATGEKETTRFGFRDLMERGKLRIIQPDVARAGGITEMRRIARMAEAHGARIIPHCWATDILVSATLHFLAAQPEAAFQEFNVMDNPLRTTLLTEPLRPRDGLLRVPEGPGLGIDLDEKTLEAYRWTPPA
jgi:L-alanine-DL-glutamate epimerase-like enolase superfamily enzyme